ncbi:MAG: 50S ribosomal protein L32 [Candidatus Moranbacteria bacterium]|nr:50S ribosomal protein L32 [Candidatus Moranbacteria bacterium]
MPVPKQKQSKSRTRKRRANDFVNSKHLVKCANCGKMKLNHRVCDNCGFYKGKEVVKIKK